MDLNNHEIIGVYEDSKEQIECISFSPGWYAVVTKIQYMHYIVVRWSFPISKKKKSSSSSKTKNLDPSGKGRSRLWELFWNGDGGGGS